MKQQDGSGQGWVCATESRDAASKGAQGLGWGESENRTQVWKGEAKGRPVPAPPPPEAKSWEKMETQWDVLWQVGSAQMMELGLDLLEERKTWLP